MYCLPVLTHAGSEFVTASKRLSTTGKLQAESSPVRPLIMFYLLLFLLIRLPLRIVTNFLVVGQAENHGAYINYVHLQTIETVEVNQKLNK